MFITPNEWGVHGWKFIHHVAWGYPRNPTDNDKLNYKNFFTMIGNILPCGGCNIHYNNNLLIYPLTDEVFLNSTNLMKWTIDMHNSVNRLYSRKIYSYEEAIALIENNYILEEAESQTELSSETLDMTKESQEFLGEAMLNINQSQTESKEIL